MGRNGWGSWCGGVFGVMGIEKWGEVDDDVEIFEKEIGVRID